MTITIASFLILIIGFLYMLRNNKNDSLYGILCIVIIWLMLIYGVLIDIYHVLS